MWISYTTAILYVTILQQSDVAATCPVLSIYAVLGVEDLHLGSLQPKHKSFT